jgi:uncharacterized membrane protein SpoIIM required for sporulation
MLEETQMIGNVRQSLRQQGRLIALLTLAFVLSAVVGMALAGWGPEPIASSLTAEDAAGNEQIERIFGGFRQSIRDGKVGAMSTCMLIVFGINTMGSVLRSVSTVFLLPLAFLLLDGCTIGASLPGLQGSSPLSVFLFLLMVGLEWVTYVLSAAAGTNVGLAVISPKRVETSSRWAALRHALSQAGSLYVVIVAILAVQAVFEILYVRKVLLMGGTGVPLAPW